MKNSAGKAPGLIRGGLVFSLAQGCFAFFLYLPGSVLNFTDDTLLLLLGVSRFFGFSALVFSLGAVILCGIALFRGLKKVRPLDAGLCLLGGVLGAGLFLLTSFIITLAGGNL
ncbi:MAG: hypothetical protein LBK66_09635 [Spirochaetaceae bacterium]|jgi:hypothetical protein|nr:hypothetical protein [Spirochaetaceae bacterium]